MTVSGGLRFRFVPKNPVGDKQPRHNAHWYLWMFPACINLSEHGSNFPTRCMSPKNCARPQRRNQNPHMDYTFLRDRGEIDLSASGPNF